MNAEPRSILVVDDNPLVCESLQFMLEFDHHKVVTASSGTEALAKAEARHFDLLLTDYYMPGMRGDELAAEVKRRNVATLIILVTASPPWGRVANVEHVLEKPCSLQRIRGMIEEVFRRA
jgi:CheY-like chemotaxis protein